MTILFLCSALEPGRDGVGDYTRRLAAELVRQGHQCRIIALHDKYLRHNSLSQVQMEQEQAISVLRMSPGLDWMVRQEEAAALINAADPDWISLQYVSYGFDDQGLPWKLPSRIRQLARRRSLHVMFHELWIDKPVNYKQRVLSLVQKLAIYQSLRILKPGQVSVTIPFNAKRLSKLGYEAQILGLFGNIPFDGEYLATKDKEEEPIAGRKLLYFGTPPTGLFLNKLIDDLHQFCSESSIRLSMTIVAGHSIQKHEFIEKLTNRLEGFDVDITDLGFVSSEQLSKLMCESHAGVSRSAPYLLGKSGTAVAMLEHGLPVWLPKWDGVAELDYGFRRHLLFADLAMALAAEPLRPIPHSLLPQTARRFAGQLYKNEHQPQ